MHGAAVLWEKKLQPNPQKSTRGVKASSVSWKPNLPVYDRLGLLCRYQCLLTVSDDRLPMDGEWGKCGVFIPSHSHQTIPISKGVRRISFKGGVKAQAPPRPFPPLPFGRQAIFGAFWAEESCWWEQFYVHIRGKNTLKFDKLTAYM